MLIHAQITIPYFTGLPEDVIQNNLYFIYVPETEPDFGILTPKITTFYNSMYAGTTVGLSWAPWVNRAGVEIKFYNLADPLPRAPISITHPTFTGVQLSTSTVTPEQAVVLSFQGAKLSGETQARRRGRIFLGGIGGNISAGNASSFPIFADTILQGICNAADAFWTSCLTDDFNWVIYSRTNNGTVPIDNGWVDNAFDTQRRRGNAPTARKTFSV